ncbi:MAG: hypothetical protein FJ044_02035 [Candidatus Cloacimonetes bacterium]|nr:hypothetical protein [Candidatus Cloacimonadota bacterium]
MPYLWDYDINEVKKSKSERAKIFLLERQINYGLFGGEKVELAKIKKYWDKLNIERKRRRLFEFLIWGK